MVIPDDADMEEAKAEGGKVEAAQAASTNEAVDKA